MRALLALVLLSTTLPALADAQLAKAKHCMACHTVDKKVVGPAYRAVAQKYAGQPQAAALLAHKIRQGGGGVWGPVPMPANNQVNADEALRLAQWVLQQK